jgi:hypothetical protein
MRLRDNLFTLLALAGVAVVIGLLCAVLAALPDVGPN